MRKYIFLLLLILVSCERDAKFNPDDTGKIYLYGIVSDGNDDIIKVNVSRPVFGEEAAMPEDVKLTLEVDGDEVELIRDVDYPSSKDGEIAYRINESFTSGQKLILKAESAGLPAAVASAMIPEQLPEVEVTHFVEESYRVKDGDHLYGSFSTLSKFHVVIDEEFSKDAFYGVQVLKRKQIEVVGTPEDPIDESRYGHEEYDNIYEYPVMTELSSVKHEIIIDHDGGELLVAEMIDEGGKMAFDVYVDNEPRYMTNAEWQGDELVYACYEYYEYKVKVFRIPNEMYHSLRSEYIKENSDAPLHLGFSPVTYAYTNVKGGLGMFAAVTSSETEWIYCN